MSRERDEEPETNSSAGGPLPEICTALVLQSPVSTWIADRYGTNIFENEAARRLFGIERDEEVVGKYNIFKDDVLIAGGFMPQIRKVFEEGGSTEIIVDYDFSWVKHVEPSQPAHKILHAFLFAIKDQDGRVRNVIVQYEDWTDRVRTEEALAESEARYREMAEGISDWIWEIDVEGRCTYSNAAIENILGYTPEEVIGKPIVEFILPEYREEVARQMGQAVAEGRGIVGSLTGEVHKDGSIRYIETNAKPVLDESGNLAGFRGMHRDVTGRVEAERALEAEKERFRALIENASDVITVMDADMTMTYVSPSVERVLGYKPEELVGKRALDYVHPDDLERGRQGIAMIAAQEGELVSTEFRLRHKDGSWVTFDALARSLLGDPAVSGIVVNHRDITERKRAEDALAESEKHFRALIVNSFDITMLVDAEGKIMYISPSVESILGFTPEEMIGTSIFDLGPPENAPRARVTFRALAEHEGMAESGREFQLRHRDGSWHIMETAAKNMLGDPAVRGIIINHRDITERKRAEEALGESEEKYRSLVESAVDAIVSADSSGRITSWNKAAEAMFGYTEEEVTGKPVTIMMPERYRAAHTKALKRMRTGAKPRLIGATTEFEGARRDGSEFPLELSLTTWLTPRGRFYSAIIRDISERKRAEEALRESNEQLATIIATSPLAVVTLDLDGKVTSWNPAAEKTFGWTQQEVIGKLMPNLPDDQLPVYREFTLRLLRGEVLTGEEVQNIRKDGTRVEISVSVAALHDSTGAIVGFMGMLADITERKRAEEALKESEEKYRTLISNMPDVVWTTRADGKTTFIGPNVTRVYGYTPEEIYEAGADLWFGRIHPDDVEAVRAAFTRLFETGTQLDIEYRVRRKDGEWIWLQDRSIGTYEKDGVLYADGVFSDISDRVEAERRAMELEEHRKEFYRKTIEAATEGKLVISERDEIKRMVGPPIASWEIKSGEDLSVIRQETAKIARESGMDENRICDFILAVGEATTNAFKHAGGGTASLHRKDDSFTMVVSDHGKGMEALALPEVALRRGYTTAFSLGMGYKTILAVADKVYLATGPAGTTVAIEMSLHAAETAEPEMTLPDTW